MRYFDRHGNRIQLNEWVSIAVSGKNRIARDTLLDGRIVSTIFVGLDMREEDGQPLIYETMVFPEEDSPIDLYMEIHRYQTREQALTGHRKVVQRLGSA